MALFTACQVDVTQKVYDIWDIIDLGSSQGNRRKNDCLPQSVYNIVYMYNYAYIMNKYAIYVYCMHMV